MFRFKVKSVVVTASMMSVLCACQSVTPGVHLCLLTGARCETAAEHRLREIAAPLAVVRCGGINWSPRTSWRT